MQLTKYMYLLEAADSVDADSLDCWDTAWAKFIFVFGKNIRFNLESLRRWRVPLPEGHLGISTLNKRWENYFKKIKTETPNFVFGKTWTVRKKGAEMFVNSQKLNFFIH